MSASPVPHHEEPEMTTILYGGKQYSRIDALVADAIEDGRKQGEAARAKLQVEIERLKGPGALPQVDAEGRVNTVCNKCGAEGQQGVGDPTEWCFCKIDESGDVVLICVVHEAHLKKNGGRGA